MSPGTSFLRWMVLFASGPMAVADLTNRIASFVSAGVKNSYWQLMELPFELSFGLIAG